MRHATTQLRCIAFAACCIIGSMPRPASAAPPVPHAEPYTVAVTSLPARLDPWHTPVGGFYYIIAQLYHPLFTRTAPSEPLVSHFLDMNRTRAADRSMRQFHVCLRHDIAFADGSAVTVDDLATSLRGIHDAQKTLADATIVKRDARCIDVSLSRSDSAYFDRLTTSACTVLKASTVGTRAPMGLGDYALEAWSASELRGVYRGAPADVDFVRFAFLKVDDLEEAVQRGIHDVNLMYWVPNKRATLRDYRLVQHPMLRNYALVTSFAEPEMGRLFARCFDVAGFVAEALQIEMLPTPGFLPRGVAGWRESLAPGGTPGECDLRHGEIPVVYVSHMDLLGATTRQFFARTQSTSRFAIQVRDGSIEDAIGLGDAGGDNVIYLLGFGAYSSQAALYGDPLTFYDFFRNHGAPQTRSQIHASLNACVSARSNGSDALYRSMHRTLLDSGAATGLGQHPPSLYYHPSIVGGTLVDPIMGYMRISTVRRRATP